jgi:hypothetical protein
MLTSLSFFCCLLREESAHLVPAMIVHECDSGHFFFDLCQYICQGMWHLTQIELQCWSARKCAAPDGDGSCVKVAFTKQIACWNCCFIKKMAPARTRLVHFRVPTPWLVSNYTISMETGQTYHLGRWLHDDIGFFPLDISVTVSTRQVS